MSKTKISLFILIILLLLTAGPVFAQGSNPNQNQITPTGFERICKNEGGELALAKCIQNIYLFSLGFGSLIALFMLVLAGYRYMTARGNAQQLTNAKDAFSSAFIGLIIIFIAFLLLYTINPELVKFRPIQGIGRLPILEYKPPGQSLAAQILASQQQITLATGHASGQPDNATAKKNIEDTNQGSPAKRSSYTHEGKTGPGGTITLSATMLQNMLQIARSTGFRFRVSEIAGGVHSNSGSLHYQGRAFDVDQINGNGVSRTHPNANGFKNACRLTGAVEFKGPGDAGHDTHIHCAW